MNQYPRATRFLTEQQWAMREATMAVMVEIANMRANGVTFSKEEIQARLGAAQKHSGRMPQGNIAVLPLQGIIGPRMNMFLDISGGTSLEMFLKEFRGYRDDPSVKAVICDIDSPGGSVYGLREVFDEIYASRGTKPMVAMVRYQCASAALFIASAFERIVSMPSGEIGSIGTLMVHEDRSEANKRDGIKLSYIVYGRYKGEGNPDEPLSDETLEYYRQQAAHWGQDFEAAVAKGRGVSVSKVRSDFGQARMLHAKDALAVGLIDAIATWEQLTDALMSHRGLQSIATRPGVLTSGDQRQREIWMTNMQLG